MEVNKVYDKILSRSVSGNTVNYLVAPKTVHQFFSIGITFRKIPDYQRPYSWTDKNVLDLLTDIRNISDNENASWFLGPVFTVQTTPEDQVSDLLDGQQRITTIQIILREASLVFLENPDISFEGNAKLRGELDDLVKDCIDCLIRRVSRGENYALFETEESVKDLFRSYILGFNHLENPTQLENLRVEFEERAILEKLKGSKTAGRILKTIGVVKGYFKNEFYNNAKFSKLENLENFSNFVNALLWRCWMLEVPLQRHDDSIQIFESLNNRGKQLTLVDKIRYKSLIAAVSADSREKIKKEWKIVYSGLESMEENHHIKNEDDFFKVFFNSISGADITDENEFIEVFSKNYLKSDETILKFLEETISVQKFYSFLDSSLDSTNYFLDNYVPKEYSKDQIKALFEVLKRSIVLSSNSRFLLFHLIRKQTSFKEGSNEIILGIWDIVRLVFLYEVFLSRKSNLIRTDFMDLIKKINAKEISFGGIIDPNDENFKIKGKSILNVLKTDDNVEAKFLLYLFSYKNDHNSLISGSVDQYKKSELDHLWPRAWKACWADKTYSREEVISYIESLDHSKYDFINFNLLIPELNNLEDLELKDYTTMPFKSSNTLIEFIGNKWVLHAGTNCGTGNSDFYNKFEKYHDDNWIKIPRNQDVEVGIDKYSDFNYMNVIERSLFIVNGILKNFYN